MDTLLTKLEQQYNTIKERHNSIVEELKLYPTNKYLKEKCLESYTRYETATSILETLDIELKLKEGDWAAYNWLTDTGEDNWKVGRIVNTKYGLMYFNDDNTNRCGYIPLTNGVIKLFN